MSSCRTPTEIYNHNNNHDTNSRRPEIGFKSSVVGKDDAKESSHDVIADGEVVPRKTKRHNTVLVTQAPPRGASAHARYLAASKISAWQDGRTVLRTRLVFAVSPRSALSHSNLATCFSDKFRNEFLRFYKLLFSGRFIFAIYNYPRKNDIIKAFSDGNTLVNERASNTRSI